MTGRRINWRKVDRRGGRVIKGGEAGSKPSQGAPSRLQRPTLLAKAEQEHEQLAAAKAIPN